MITFLEFALTWCLLMQECSGSPRENWAIASTIIQRVDQNQSSAILELIKPNQYPIRFDRVGARVLDRPWKDQLVKIWAIGKAVRNPLKFTHYHTKKVRPDWSKHGVVIGEHVFVNLKKGE